MDKIKGELIYISCINYIKDNPEKVEAAVDFILNLSSWCNSDRAKENSYTHISIADGPKTSYIEFKSAVDILLDRIDNDDMCLVHCAAGHSRSVSVAATAIADRRDQSFEEALGRVRSSHPTPSRPHPALVKHGKNYLDKN